MFSLVSSSVTTIRRRVWRSLVMVASPTMVELVYWRFAPALDPEPPEPPTLRLELLIVVGGRDWEVLRGALEDGVEAA
jgi:hypothetical protein